MSAAIPRTVWHEAFTLPIAFLSVALLGGLRIDTAGRFGFAPPPGAPPRTRGPGSAG